MNNEKQDVPLMSYYGSKSGLVWVLCSVGFLSVSLNYLAEHREVMALNRPATNRVVEQEANFTMMEGNGLLFLPEGSTLIAKDQSLDFDTTIEYDGSAEVQELSRQLMRGAFCRQKLRNAEQQRILVNVTFHCMDLFEHSGMGTGNYITSFYGLRMAAHAVGNVDVSIQCTDAQATQASLVIPWLTGYFPGVVHSIPVINRTRPKVEEACTNFNQIALGYKLASIQYELRRMAIALVGLPSSNHPSAQFLHEMEHEGSNNRNSRDGSELQVPFPTSPLYPDVELDDAVLHFRCGDLMKANHPSFGFMKFRSFSRHISVAARSIGIVTQPFELDAPQQRAREKFADKLDSCRLVVSEFVKHLQQRFPKARITIRNDRNETIALTFARMVMANQSIVAISTFSVLPTLATFGHGYIRKPDYPKAPNQFLLHPNIEDLTNHVSLIEESRLMAKELNEMWDEDGTRVIEWFRSDP